MKRIDNILVLEEDDLKELFEGVTLAVPAGISQIMLRDWVLADYKLVPKKKLDPKKKKISKTSNFNTSLDGPAIKLFQED